MGHQIFCGFCRRIFSHHFRGKKCPEKSSRKIPGKILHNLYIKYPRHISAEGPGQKLFSGLPKPSKFHGKLCPKQIWDGFLELLIRTKENSSPYPKIRASTLKEQTLSATATFFLNRPHDITKGIAVEEEEEEDDDDDDEDEEEEET